MTESEKSSKLTEGNVRRGRYLGIALALIAGGAVLLIYMLQTRRGPSGEGAEDLVRVVRVFEARRGPHRVAVTAFGTSRASQEWSAIAEVAGRAVAVHDRFEAGEVLAADTLLVQIDPTDYQLAVRRFEAEIRSRQAQLRELDETEGNLRRIVKLQKRQLELAESEFERYRETHSKGAISDSALASVEAAMVARLTAMEETTSQLNLMPAQRDRLATALDVVQTQLDQAQRQLEKCQVRLPYRAQCVAKAVETDQVVATGQPLGTFRALDTAEVVAMVEAGKMGTLFPGGMEGFDVPIDLAEIGTLESLFEKVRIPADIRWGPPERDWIWKGRFSRITGTLDPATRTVPVVFEVPHPYRDIRPGVRPPLVPGAFCEVTAYGAKLDDVAVIPRDCLHEGRVYLLRSSRAGQEGVLEGGQLEVAAVEVLVLEEELAVVGDGINSGDLVILGGPLGEWKGLGGAALPGMPLRGRLVENPVSPRGEVDVPADLFEQRPEQMPAATKPKTVEPPGGTGP